MRGLQKAYPKLTSQKLRKEASDIACQLSTQYKSQHSHLLFHYLSCQNRLIQFKISAGVDDIHYNIFFSGLEEALLE